MSSGSGITGTCAMHDDRLPAVTHLAGDAAAGIVAASFAAIGVEVRDVVVDQVQHEPGRSCTVTYDVGLRWADGTCNRETFVATTSVDGPPVGAAVLESEGVQIGVWRYPFDPVLPGLADAVLPGRASRFVGPLVGEPVRQDVLGHRAGRRAVVRVEGGSGTVYLKVVRPDRVERLVRVHEALRGAGLAVPAVLAVFPSDGVVVLGELVGQVLRDSLSAAAAAAGYPAVSAERTDGGGCSVLLDELSTQLDLLATCTVDRRPARRDALRDLTMHVRVLRASMPEAGRMLDDLVAVIDPTRPDPVVPVLVHGDLHDAQVLVGPDGRLAGLLDLDDVGMGHPADDLANLLGHLRVVAQEEGVDRESILAMTRTVPRHAAARGIDADALARRAAAVVVGLATGPSRARSPRWRTETLHRLEIARELCRLAADGSGPSSACEISLMSPSPASHLRAGEQRCRSSTPW